MAVSATGNRAGKALRSGAAILAAAVIAAGGAASRAQSPPAAPTTPPAVIAFRPGGDSGLAQQPPPAAGYPGSAIPTDVSPFNIVRESGIFSPYLRFKIFSRLPSRLWFSSATESDQRLETNVFQTSHKKHADYVYRILPNVTAGWNFADHLTAYCNYFVIKDLFARHAAALDPPTTQSLSTGVRHDFDVTGKTNLQLDFQARELWQASHIRQADLIPAINVTRVLAPGFFMFGATLLQLRGREPFQGPGREIDPYYTLGFVLRRGNWTFVISDTLVNSFRRKNAVPAQSANTMVADFEIFRPLSRGLPGAVGFIRAEPIWNWDSFNLPGQSGFDFRLYSGVRLSLSKPAYNMAINRLRRQLQEIQEMERQPPPGKPKAQPAPEPAAPSG